MTVDYLNLLTVLFDKEGRYLEILIREFSQETQLALKVAIAAKGRTVFGKDWKDLDQWAAELGFTPGVIAVEKFCLPQYKLCIRDLPAIYEEILASGADLDEEMKEEIRNWQEVNDYVLVWGQEYDIDNEGDIVST